MFKFGFELEGFYRKDGVITIPPREFPVDGFPGLCEVRTFSGQFIDDAYFSLVKEYAKYLFDTSTSEHVFSPLERQQLRARPDSPKHPVSISNVYAKNPRLLGNRTLASFQINISYLLSGEYTKKDGVRFSARYGLFDFLPIVKKLDREFREEIGASGRQPGFYAIKDITRLEYRSLPCTVFQKEPEKIKALLGRVESCLP